MSATNGIDFTTWRKGKRTRGGCTIQVCPKCGRKGEMAHVAAGLLGKKQIYGFSTYTHKGHVIGGWLFSVDESCKVSDPVTDAPVS